MIFFDKARFFQGFEKFNYDSNISLEGFSLNLISLHFYAEILTIDDYCLSYCESLSKINLPNSITTIDECCFHYCSQLTKIILFNSIEELPERCFS
jgi:hypothetical protein